MAGANLVIALTHVGYTRDRAIARKVSRSLGDLSWKGGINSIQLHQTAANGAGTLAWSVALSQRYSQPQNAVLQAAGMTPTAHVPGVKAKPRADTGTPSPCARIR